jgi:hypothetical protein
MYSMGQTMHVSMPPAIAPAVPAMKGSLDFLTMERLLVHFGSHSQPSSKAESGSGVGRFEVFVLASKLLRFVDFGQKKKATIS